MRSPREAMDYPKLDDGKFVIWVWNGLTWPDAKRHVGYLTSRKRDPMSSAPLFTTEWNSAEVFDTAEEARAFLDKATDDRGHPYNATISDVWYLKVLCGYEPPPAAWPVMMTRTGRGFEVGHFTDRYGVKCSIQKSSLATEDAILLGPDHPEPKALIEGKGWLPVALPDGCIINTRMHLTREQVIALLPLLMNFARTGDLT